MSLAQREGGEHRRSGGPGGVSAPAAGRGEGGRIPPKRYRIGELVEFAGVSRQTIHNYTTMGLLRESNWTPGGHRLYDESAFDRLEEIARLKAASKTMAEIRAHFARRNGM